MRINKFVAQASGLSRRAADSAIQSGRVTVNGTVAGVSHTILATDVIALDGQPLKVPSQTSTLMMNKPVGFVCSRDGQGSKTVYDLIPQELHHLKPVGRLDKDSSGLLLMSDDGDLTFQLTHPKFEKTKVYQVKLDRELTASDINKISGPGILLEDGISSFRIGSVKPNVYEITMHEGRNRQIRRTLETLGYKITGLHRIKFGPYSIESLDSGAYKQL